MPRRYGCRKARRTSPIPCTRNMEKGDSRPETARPRSRKTHSCLQRFHLSAHARRPNRPDAHVASLVRVPHTRRVGQAARRPWRMEVSLAGRAGHTHASSPRLRKPRAESHRLIGSVIGACLAPQVGFSRACVPCVAYMQRYLLCAMAAVRLGLPGGAYAGRYVNPGSRACPLRVAAAGMGRGARARSRHPLATETNL